MAIDRVKAFFAERGMEGRVLEFDTSSATVELAAIGLVGGVLAAVGSAVCLLGLARRAR